MRATIRYSLLTAARLVILAALLCPAWAQTKAGPDDGFMQIDATVLVGADEPALPLWETAAAVNPTDPRNLIVAANASPKHEQRWAGTLYFSRDGGATWHRVLHGPQHEPMFWSRDPALAFGPEGTAYYATLEFDEGDVVVPGYSPGGPRMLCTTHFYRSKDGGENWSEPIRLAGSDFPQIAIDKSEGPFRGRLYVATIVHAKTLTGEDRTTVGFAHSDDGGAHFQERVFMPTTVKDAHGTEIATQMSGIAVAPDGSPLLLFASFSSDPATHQTTGQAWLAKSKDGGRTFGPLTLAASATSGVPVFAVDLSARPTRGNIYVAYPAGQDKSTHIAVVRSTDGGSTWGPAVPVSAGDGQQAGPAMAVNNDGVLAVTWEDWRTDPRTACYQEYTAVSLDGGLSFPDAQPLKTSLVCSDVGLNQYFSGGESESSEDGQSMVFRTGSALGFPGGDYQSLIAWPSGRFQMLWSATEKGVLVSSVFHVNGASLGHEVTRELAITMSHPYFDATQRTIAMDFRVQNTSRQPLSLPLVLQLSGLDTSAGKMKPLDSWPGSGPGAAAWLLESPEGNARLMPGEQTRSMTVRFAPDAIEEKKAKFSFDASNVSLEVAARVFEKR